MLCFLQCAATGSVSQKSRQNEQREPTIPNGAAPHATLESHTCILRLSSDRCSHVPSQGTSSTTSSPVPAPVPVPLLLTSPNTPSAFSLTLVMTIVESGGKGRDSREGSVHVLFSWWLGLGGGEVSVPSRLWESDWAAAQLAGGGPGSQTLDAAHVPLCVGLEEGSGHVS